MAETPADYTPARGRPRRPARRHQRDRPPAADRHHPGLASTTSSISARRWPRSPARRPASSSAASGCIVGRAGARGAAVIEARADALGGAADGRGPGLAVWEEHGRMAYPRCAAACSTCRCRTSSARTRSATPAPRSPRCGRSAWTRRPAPPRVTRAEWPARLQRLRRGPLVEAAGTCRALARRRPQPRRRRGARPRR